MTSRKGSPWKPSLFMRDGSRVRTTEQKHALREDARTLGRVHVPGKDPEPPMSAELVDREGVPWHMGSEGRESGWSPEGEPALGLKWSSPAMSHAGPFMGPWVRTEDEIRADAASAARARWDREKKRAPRK